MCDSFVAVDDQTAAGVTLFAKNSDRRADECQPFVQFSEANHPPEAMLNCTHIAIHQVAETYASGEPAYDGVAELSFADHAAFDGYWNSDRIQAIFAADAPMFLDGENCSAFLAEETRLRWP